MQNRHLSLAPYSLCHPHLTPWPFNTLLGSLLLGVYFVPLCWTQEDPLAFWEFQPTLKDWWCDVHLFGDGCGVSRDLLPNTPGVLFTLASRGFFFLFLFKIPGWIIHHYLEFGSLSSSHLYSTKVSTTESHKALDQHALEFIKRHFCWHHNCKGRCTCVCRYNKKKKVN